MRLNKTPVSGLIKIIAAVSIQDFSHLQNYAQLLLIRNNYLPQHLLSSNQEAMYPIERFQSDNGQENVK